MAFLNKDILLAKQELEIKKVDLEDGNFVYVREMTGRERDTLEESLITEKKGKKGKITFERNLSDFRAKLACSTICDEEGNNLLTIKDAPTLSTNMGAKRLSLIVEVAEKLNKMSEEDKDDLTKNSEAEEAEDSSSDSA